MKKKSIQSQGGEARAKALTPGKRQEIARRAAATRWNHPKALLDGEICIGSVSIPCYVLEDGTRVLSQRGLQSTLGMSTGGAAQVGARRIRSLITQFEGDDLGLADLLERVDSPLVFLPTHGGRTGFGYEATVLTDLCEFILKCRDQKLLKTRRQQDYAKAAEIILRSLAKVGIIALVDEATGYQTIRDSMALRAILDRYIKDEWARWSKTFPDEFYTQMFRLKGIPIYQKPGAKKPGYVGHWTNDIVYSRLAPGVLTELRRVNPKTPAGNRRRKHFQHLTEDVGNPALKEHLQKVIFLMKGFPDGGWAEFKKALNRASQKFGDTIPMDV